MNQISSDVGLNINKVHKNTGVITWGKKVNLDNLTSFDVSESRGFVRSLGDLEVKSKNLGPTQNSTYTEVTAEIVHSPKKSLRQ